MGFDHDCRSDGIQVACVKGFRPAALSVHYAGNDDEAGDIQMTDIMLLTL